MADAEVQSGYRWEWCLDEKWQVGGDGRTCRWLGCKNPAVAALPRRNGNRSHVWWYYCKSHMYGREIKDGVVKVQRLIKLGEVG